MNRAQILIVFISLVLAIFQVSFAPHLKVFSGPRFGWINFVDLAVLIIAVFERRRGRLGWLGAIIGGIFLDIYSARFFGFWIITLLAVVAAVKLLLKKYVRIPSFW